MYVAEITETWLPKAFDREGLFAKIITMISGVTLELKSLLGFYGQIHTD